MAVIGDEKGAARANNAVANLIGYVGIDLILILLFILLTLVFIYVPGLNDTILRSALGLVMILFIPGYTLIAALFPGRDDIDGIERAALSFGLSIAVVPLIGLGLNFTPWGIRLDPILVCLTIFTVLCVAVAIGRRHMLRAEDRFSIDFRKVYVGLKDDMFDDKTRFDKALTLILVFAIILSVATVAYVIAVPKQGEKFTEFYILGQNGKADGYPTKFNLGDSKPVIVGIGNHEYSNVTYDLVIAMNYTTSYHQIYTENITVANNQTWEKLINLTPDRTGTNMEMEFLLYANGNMTAPYRELHLWVNVANKTSVI